MTSGNANNAAACVYDAEITAAAEGHDLGTHTVAFRAHLSGCTRCQELLYDLRNLFHDRGFVDRREPAKIISIDLATGCAINHQSDIETEDDLKMAADDSAAEAGWRLLECDDIRLALTAPVNGELRIHAEREAGPLSGLGIALYEVTATGPILIGCAVTSGAGECVIHNVPDRGARVPADGFRLSVAQVSDDEEDVHQDK